MMSTASARSPSSALARQGSPAPISWRASAIGRKSSRLRARPAACWCRRFLRIACRGKKSKSEIRMIERLGVTIETGKRLGRDFTIEGLRADGYESIFLGVGCPEGARLGIPGDKTPGVVESLDFLQEHNLKGDIQVGKHVAVIGGGNTAIDCRPHGAASRGGESYDRLSANPRADAGMGRGNSRRRGRRHHSHDVRCTRGSSRQGRLGDRSEMPPSNHGRLRQERPPQTGGRNGP